MGFPGKNTGVLPFPPPGNLPDPGIEPRSPPWPMDSLPLSHLGSPQRLVSAPKFADSVSWEGLEERTFPSAMSTFSVRAWFLRSLPRTRSPGSLEKWLISGLGREIQEVSLDHLLVPESKEMLNTCMRMRTHTHTHPMGFVKGTQKPKERASHSQNWNNLSKNVNHIDLGCNLKCKNKYQQV